MDIEKIANDVYSRSMSEAYNKYHSIVEEIKKEKQLSKEDITKLQNIVLEKLCK